MKKSRSDKKGAIICLDWDNHSPNYLLIGHLSGEIFLIDTEKMIIMQEFEKINTGKFLVMFSLNYIKFRHQLFVVGSRNTRRFFDCH